MNNEMKSRLKAMELSAYHEAGQAVMCYLMRKSFDKASVYPPGGSSGKSKIKKATLIGKLDESDACVLLAGQTAQLKNLWNNKPRYLPGFIFRRIMEKEFKRIYGETSQYIYHTAFVIPTMSQDEDSNQRFQEVTCKVWQMFNLPNNWQAVEKLAAELILRKEIHYLNACKIMKKAIKEGSC